MKVIKLRKVSKIMDRFDSELKALLMNDLKAIKAITGAKTVMLNGNSQATGVLIA